MKINIIVIPNSKSFEILKIDESSYKIKVDSPAREGKANKRLVEILSKYFHVPNSSIKILKGFNNRNKIVSIDS